MSLPVGFVGFAPPEMERLAACLRRLMPHVCRDALALTGGVAIQLGLADVGHSGWRTSIADLDFVASRLDAIAPSVSTDFLVSHYHVPQPNVPKFMVQLVDPISRIRIDIFPDVVGSLRSARTIVIAGHPINVLELQRIFEHKRGTMAKASAARPVDPKHDRDARTLGALFGCELAPTPETSLREDVYGGDEDLTCTRCEMSKSADFPLTPKSEIFRLLGWPS